MSDYSPGASAGDHPTWARQRHAARQAADAQARADQAAAAAKTRADRDVARAVALRASDRAAGLWAMHSPNYHGGDGSGFNQLLPPAERRMFVYHVVDLAREAPAVPLRWVTPGSTVERLVRAGHAMYHCADRTAVAPGIATIEDAARMLHEIGHGRTASLVGGTLRHERAAWEFARQHMLVWDAACHRLMATCLRSYLDATTTRGDVLDVMAIEQDLLSPASFARYQRVSPAGRLVEHFEAREFVAVHGARACECGVYCATPDAPAVAFDANRAVCRGCRTVRHVDRTIRIQQMRRASMQSA